MTMAKRISNEPMVLRAEFRKRLERLDDAIDEALAYDTADGDLLPALFNCLTYLWCNSDYSKPVKP